MLMRTCNQLSPSNAKKTEVDLGRARTSAQYDITDPHHVETLRIVTF